MNKTIEQLAEENVNRFFGNRLSPEERAWALKINKEIYWEWDLESKALALDEWRKRVAQFEQDLQTRLNQAETPEERAIIRFAYLFLHQIAGDAAENIFEQPQERIDYCFQGIQHAQAFLNDGETAPAVREMVLKLYVNVGNTQGQLGQPEAELDTYQQGIQHAQAFLNDGETAPTVRELVLQLYRNAGFTQGKLGQIEAALDTLKQGIQHAQAFLNDGETAPGVREEVLQLYRNAGVTQDQLGQPEAELETYQQGIQHAQAFLNDGETAPAVREQVLKLYDSYSSTYYNMGQTSQTIPLLPFNGLWSWLALTQLAQTDTEEWKRILRNWQLHLETSPSFPHFTAAFQELLYSIVTVWHQPQKNHRHFGFLPTEKLLAICESLYAIEQAQQNQRLKKVYDSLTALAESKWIKAALNYQNEIHRLNVVLGMRKEFPKLLLPLYRWWLKIKVSHYQSLVEQYQQSVYVKESWETHSEWQKAVQQTELALVDWLSAAVLKHLVFSTQGLEDLPAIALGLLLVCDSLKTKQSLEMCLQTWQHNPPWQSAEQLRAIFDVSNWQTWSDNEKSNLSSWTYSLERNDTTRRLSIQWQQENKAQPDLQTWLKELLTEDGQTLRENLARAWENANQQIDDLYRISSIFSEWAGPQRPETALATIILGDVKSDLKTVIRTWLIQLAPFDQDTPILEIFNALKYRFTRAVNLYQPYRPHLEKTVHNWAQIYLKEILPQPDHDNALEKEEPTGFDSFSAFYPTNEDFSHFQFQPAEPPLYQRAPGDFTTYSKIWEILERARIGLTGLTLQLEDNWDEKLGKELWQDLGTSIRQLSEGYQPPDHQMWPLLSTWFQKMDKWIHNKPPSVETCQHALAHKEALVQPFLDPVQQRFRVLWLDNNGLALRDLPNDCAPESLWTDIVEPLKKYSTAKTSERGDKISTTLKYLEQIMQSPPVQSFTNQLNDWATDCERLTVIWPAPLGQFPWEIVSPVLELKLTREISVRHWLEMRQAEISTSPRFDRLNERKEIQKDYWVICDPSGEKACMIKEGQWVANYFNTQLDAPCPSLFDALHNLAKSRQSHLSVHGQFDRQNPTASCLTLNENQKQYWPLWTISATRTNADLIMLSACESNLTGPDTQGLLTPIGIGPSLVAAGAKTVVGTLWSCEGIAALCFNYYFYQIATDPNNTNKPWHHIAAEARQKLRNMQRDDLQQIINECDLEDENDLCHQRVKDFKARSRFGQGKPFEQFEYWAGFVVLGLEKRSDAGASQ